MKVKISIFLITIVLTGDIRKIFAPRPSTILTLTRSASWYLQITMISPTCNKVLQCPQRALIHIPLSSLQRPEDVRSKIHGSRYLDRRGVPDHSERSPVTWPRENGSFPASGQECCHQLSWVPLPSFHTKVINNDYHQIACRISWKTFTP